MLVSKSQDINAGLDCVWSIISQTDNDQKYWILIRDVKVLNAEGNTIEREAVVGPAVFSQKTRQTVVKDPKKRIVLTITGDKMNGERRIDLVPISGNSARVEVTWNLEARSVPSFVQGIMKNHIAKATEAALTKIAREAEGRTAGAG